jgi:hypothetical protein
MNGVQRLVAVCKPLRRNGRGDDVGLQTRREGVEHIGQTGVIQAMCAPDQILGVLDPGRGALLRTDRVLLLFERQ